MAQLILHVRLRQKRSEDLESKNFSGGEPPDPPLWHIV